MHKRNIAHWYARVFLNCKRIVIKYSFLRDCTANIMLDPSGMYPEGFHPIQINHRSDFRGRAKRFTRTLRPTRHHLIDIGLSRWRVITVAITVDLALALFARLRHLLCNRIIACALARSSPSAARKGGERGCSYKVANVHW